MNAQVAVEVRDDLFKVYTTNGHVGYPTIGTDPSDRRKHAVFFYQLNGDVNLELPAQIKGVTIIKRIVGELPPNALPCWRTA